MADDPTKVPAGMRLSPARAISKRRGDGENTDADKR